MSNDNVAAGLGVITFFDNGECTALLRPISQDAWHRGKYVGGHGVDIETDAVSLALRVLDKPTDKGPRLRGYLTVKETGERKRVVAWRASLEDGTPCLGLSEDAPMPQRIAAPF
jgi:hypothetical protein